MWNYFRSSTARDCNPPLHRNPTSRNRHHLSAESSSPARAPIRRRCPLAGEPVREAVGISAGSRPGTRDQQASRRKIHIPCAEDKRRAVQASARRDLSRFVRPKTKSTCFSLVLRKNYIFLSHYFD